MLLPLITLPMGLPAEALAGTFCSSETVTQSLPDSVTPEAPAVALASLVLKKGVALSFLRFGWLWSSYSGALAELASLDGGGGEVGIRMPLSGVFQADWIAEVL